jgi:hypothetical protein
MSARYTLRYSSGAHDSHGYTRARAVRMRTMLMRWYPELGVIAVVRVPATAPAPG